MEEGYFLKDTALMDKSKDAFHHEDYVKNLKKIIEEHEPPFNIALIGKWGVGKSSIINLLKEELKGKPEFVTHEINAWKYENDSLKKAFLKNLWQTFNRDKDISLFKLFTESFRETSVHVDIEDKTVTPKQLFKDIFPIMLNLVILFFVSSVCVLGVLYLWDVIQALFTSKTFSTYAKDTFPAFKKNIWVTIIVGPLVQWLQELVKSSIQSKMADVKLVKPVETADEYEELFKHAIANYKKTHPRFKKLVVIVDDLDRLSTKKVVAALDAIKAFVEINECIFIVTCDENILINAIEKEKLNKSIDIDGELFLDKLFHFRIPLPPIIENDMRTYAIDISNQEVPGLVKLCNGQFEEIIDILIHAEVTTPRQVKKLLNSFSNNLLIANSREAQNRKLEQQLLTGENGLRFLAKLSVLQSDYNDIYIQLAKDFNFLEDLVAFYQDANPNGTEIKPSIKSLFNQKDSTFKIKASYEGLINFLMRTQHIAVGNISPFIYLAQDAIGLKAGDEKQRAIRRNLVSGNEKAIIDLLNEESNNENLVYAIVEEVKHSSRKDFPSVIKAGIQLINHINDQKKDLANGISYLLTTIDTSQIRFWQIEPKNLLAVYDSAENKNGIEKALLYVLDQLFSKSEDWKNVQGQEMETEKYIHEISIYLELLLDAHPNLPLEVINKVKSFIADTNNEHTFYPFERIHSLYKNHRELFWDYFGFPFSSQLVSEMSVADESSLNEEMETFLAISPMIRERDSHEFVRLMPSVIGSSPTDKIMSAIRLLNPVLDMIDMESGSKIVEEITYWEYQDRSGIREVLSIIPKIPFSIQSQDTLGETLNKFILKHLPKEKDDITGDIIDVMKHVLLKDKVDFTVFDKVFNYVVEHVLEGSVNDAIFERLSPYLSDSQRTILFNKINPPALFQTYDTGLFDRVYSLFAILVNDVKNNSFIQNMMSQGVSHFQANQWNQKPAWAEDYIRLLSIAGDKLEESVKINFINALKSHVNNQGRHDLVIRAFMYMGREMPESTVVESIDYAIANANTDSSKMDAFEFVKSCNRYITKENNNITTYVNFLLENFQLKVKSYLDELYSKFSSISENNLITFITKAANLSEDKLEANLTIMQNVTRKFLSALDSIESKGNVLYQVISLVSNTKAVNGILLEALEKGSSVLLLNEVINSDFEMDKHFRAKLLKLSVPYHESIEKAGFTNLIVDVLRDNDDTYIIETCDILLNEYKDFRFGNEKKHISAQIVPTFRNVNMEAKKKVLEVAKQFDLQKEFVQAVKDKLLSEEEEDLVSKLLGFRKNRKHETVTK